MKITAMELQQISNSITAMEFQQISNSIDIKIKDNVQTALSEELKKAGFPQNLGLEAIGVDYDMPPYSPTLSELIEKCFDFYYPCHFEMGGSSTWWAIMRNEANTKSLVPVQTGSTPREAVAKLWLALNKEKI